MQKGITIIQDIDVQTIEKYINWRYFFNAWGLVGDFRQIENADLTQKEVWLSQYPLSIQPKASEAFQLFIDAKKLLNSKKRNGSNKCERSFHTAVETGSIYKVWF